MIREARLSTQVACCLYAALTERLRLTVKSGVDWDEAGRRGFSGALSFLNLAPALLKTQRLAFSLSLSTSLLLCSCLFFFFFPPLTFPASLPPSFPTSLLSSLDRSLSYFCAVSLTDCCLNIYSESLPDLRAHQIITESRQMAFIK